MGEKDCGGVGEVWGAVGVMCIYSFTLFSVHSCCHPQLGVLQSRVPLILLRVENSVCIVPGKGIYLEACDP